MAFVKWIKDHSRYEILILASLAYLFAFLNVLGTLEGDSGSYIFGQILFLMILGGLYAFLCISQFLPNERVKTIALTVFLFYYAIDRLGAISTPFYFLGVTSNGLAVSFGVFFLFAMLAYLVFFVLYGLNLFFPKIRFPRLLPIIFLYVWIGCSLISMILVICINAQVNIAWGTYFGNVKGYLLLPLLFFVAYCSCHTKEKEETILPSDATSPSAEKPSESSN